MKKKAREVEAAMAGVEQSWRGTERQAGGRMLSSANLFFFFTTASCLFISDRLDDVPHVTSRRAERP